MRTPMDTLCIVHFCAQGEPNRLFPRFTVLAKVELFLLSLATLMSNQLRQSVHASLTGLSDVLGDYGAQKATDNTTTQGGMARRPVSFPLPLLLGLSRHSHAPFVPGHFCAR